MVPADVFGTEIRRKFMSETANLLQMVKELNNLHHIVYKNEIYDIMKIRPL